MRRTNAFGLAFVGNLLALPLYLHTLGPLTLCVSRNMGTQMQLAMAGALAAGAGAAWAWSRSARRGAVVQTLVVLPVVVRLALDTHRMSRMPRLEDFADSRVLFAVVVIGALGVLVAIPIVVLLRARAQRHDD